MGAPLGAGAPGEEVSDERLTRAPRPGWRCTQRCPCDGRWNAVDRRLALGDDLRVGVPVRQVRAVYSAESITVYQAYPPQIAEPAVAAGRLVPPFSRDRMTWIKPSFLWMMYRSDWGTAPGQERVLAIEITRTGFEWALTHSCLTHFDAAHDDDRGSWSRRLKRSPVRVQWDPERSLTMGVLPYRSLQVGLSGEAVDQYVDEWIIRLADVTALARTMHRLVRAGDKSAATAVLPLERPYPLPAHLAAVINASPL